MVLQTPFAGVLPFPLSLLVVPLPCPSCRAPAGTCYVPDGEDEKPLASPASSENGHRHPDAVVDLSSVVLAGVDWLQYEMSAGDKQPVGADAQTAVDNHLQQRLRQHHSKLRQWLHQPRALYVHARMHASFPERLAHVVPCVGRREVTAMVRNQLGLQYATASAIASYLSVADDVEHWHTRQVPVAGVPRQATAGRDTLPAASSASDCSQTDDDKGDAQSGLQWTYVVDEDGNDVRYSLVAALPDSDAGHKRFIGVRRVKNKWQATCYDSNLK